MFIEASVQDRNSGGNLVGRIIQIYWDGDNVYYMGRVTEYVAATKLHKVTYFGDDSGAYDENLISLETTWQIWNSGEMEFNRKYIIPAENIQKKEDRASRTSGASTSNTNNSNKPPPRAKMTYIEMILASLFELDNKNGSTAQSIRKYMLKEFFNSGKTPQSASFNNLAKKALEQAILQNKVYKATKAAYKLTKSEYEKRRDEALGIVKFKAGGKRGGVNTGTSVENNKGLRKEFIEMKAKRDKHLSQYVSIIEGFLPEKQNYFQRKERKDVVSDLFTSYEIDLKHGLPPLKSDLTSESAIDVEHEEKMITTHSSNSSSSSSSSSNGNDVNEIGATSNVPFSSSSVPVSITDVSSCRRIDGVNNSSTNTDASISVFGAQPPISSSSVTTSLPESSPAPLQIDAPVPSVAPMEVEESISSAPIPTQASVAIPVTLTATSTVSEGMSSSSATIDMHQPQPQTQGNPNLTSNSDELAVSATAAGSSNDSKNNYKAAPLVALASGAPAAGLRSTGIAPTIHVDATTGKPIKTQKEVIAEEREKAKRSHIRFDRTDGRTWFIKGENRVSQMLAITGLVKPAGNKDSHDILMDTYTLGGVPFLLNKLPLDIKPRYNHAGVKLVDAFATEDATAMDMIIDEGVFQGYKVVWPGRRLHPDATYPEIIRPNSAASNALSHKHVYYLMKERDILEVNDLDELNDSSNCRSGSSNSSSSSSDAMDAENINPYEMTNELKVMRETITDLDPIYVTALRMADGRFITHSQKVFKHTMSYAKKQFIPISNSVQFAIICPHTGEPRTIQRPFCDSRIYMEAFKRMCTDKLRESPSLLDRLVSVLNKQDNKAELEKEEREEFLNACRDHLDSMKDKSKSATDGTEDLVDVEGVEGAVTTSSSTINGKNVDDATNVDGDISNGLATNHIEGENEEVGEGEGDAAPAPILKELTENLTTMNVDNVPLLGQPVQLRALLHEHQILGISWMIHMFQHGMPMILGDQMGLGKTLQTIGFLCHLKFTFRARGPYLIVVPLSVLSNWQAEIERFCPQLRAIRFHGPREERERIKEDELRSLAEFDIVLTTYEMLVSEANFFKRRYMWTSVVVDEGHRLKNEKSQLSEKLRQIPTLCRVILTGTPLQNNLRELWALLHFLAPDIFVTGSAKFFEDGFDLHRGKMDNTLLRNARDLLQVFMLRRLKDNISIKLPSRREVTLLVPLTEEQNEWYRTLLCSMDSNTIEVVMQESAKTNSTDSLVELDGAGVDADADTNAHGTSSSSSASATSSALANITTTTAAAASDGSTVAKRPRGESDWRKLMNLLLQLRKVCNHVHLIQDPDYDDDSDDNDEENDGEEDDKNVKIDERKREEKMMNSLIQGSGKLLMLDRMLPRLREDGHRVLLFSQFTSMLDILESYCESRNLPFARLDGNTNRVQRRLDVKRFNATGSKLFIFLISTRAGGLGLNLASADTVILYDSDWNPQVDLQAMERAHRIGQTKPVRVYRLVCRGSVEERMVNRAEKKLFLNAMVAEKQEEKEKNENDKDIDHDNDDNQVSNALGISSSSMSKGELASLIRFGANAVMESSNDISDAELDVLLEREGRDLPPPPPLLPSETDVNTHTMNVAATSHIIETDPVTTDASTVGDKDLSIARPQTMDEIEKMQASLRDRSEVLQEIDLRQLGNHIFATRKLTKAERTEKEKLAAFGDGNLIADDIKRKRKQRIVMVDGAGSGYGNSVPVLANNLESDDEDDGKKETKTSNRSSRLWDHHNFCALCSLPRARRVSESANVMVQCAHCPFVFHLHCLEDYGLARTGGMFICPHHKCSTCNRSTSAAGGLLFRCDSCFTSFCEDCLPQEDIESFGKCKAFEEVGYRAKQAYFIRCPPCCLAHNDHSTKNTNNSDHDAPPQELLPSQELKIQWVEEVDSEDEREDVRLAKIEEEKEAARLKEEKRRQKEAERKAAEKAKAEAAAAKERVRLAKLKSKGKSTSSKDKAVATSSSRGKPSKFSIKDLKNSNGKKKGTKKEEAVSSSSVASSSRKRSKKDDSHEEENDEKKGKSKKVVIFPVKIPSNTKSIAMDNALDYLLKHPHCKSMMEDGENGGSSSAKARKGEVSCTTQISLIRAKVSSGRYRNKQAFTNDIEHCIRQFEKKNKEIAGDETGLAAFYKTKVEPLIQ